MPGSSAGRETSAHRGTHGQQAADDHRVPLDPYDLGILRFEKRPWRDSWAKGQAIAEQFGITPIRYYQRLAQLIDTPAALAAEPVLVGRLRRIRDARRTALAPGRRGARTRA